ncbi:hypothetical protein KCU91_g1402, partial [Aureobasidium melanogenum]
MHENNNTLADEMPPKSKTTEKVSKWGTGLFENDADLSIVRDLTRESGFEEAGSTNFLYLGHPKAHEYRRWFDSGALNKMLKKRLSVDDTTIFAGQDDKESMWLYPPNRCHGYHLCLLGAVMMTLGCKIRPDFRKSLEELHTKVGFSRNAQVQLRHALNIYVDGTAYDFRSKSRPVGLDNDDWASDSMWGDLSESLCKLDDSVDPFMKQLARQMFGPLMKCVIAGDNEKPQDACGYCGNKKAEDGSPCQPCSQCNQRLYCSRKCELAHRPQHKLVCNDRFYRIMGNAWAKAQKAAIAAEAQGSSSGSEEGGQTTDNASRANTSSTDVTSASASASASAANSSDDFDDMPTCGNCGVEATFEQPLLLCRKCKKQHYCNKKCQKSHWHPTLPFSIIITTTQSNQLNKQHQTTFALFFIPTTSTTNQPNNPPLQQKMSQPSGNITPNSSSGNSTPYSPASTPQSVTFIISPPTSPYPTPATPWSPYEQNPFYDK